MNWALDDAKQKHYAEAWANDPFTSEVLRQAVLDYRDKIARKVEAQRGRK